MLNLHSAYIRLLAPVIIDTGTLCFQYRPIAIIISVAVLNKAKCTNHFDCSAH